MFWHKWLKAFEHYIEVLGQDKLVDSTKCALLQNCLGPEGQHIFTSLIHSETTYSAAISVLTGYFSSDYTSQMYRLKFHQRAQMPGETIDQFVSALEELLSPCNYGDLQEKLILDQLIAKTSCPQLRDRLLLEKEPLTLAAALVISREVESALNESEQFGFHEVSVDIGDDLDPPVQRKAKRGRPRRGEERAKTKPPLTKTQSKPSNYKDNYYYSSDKLYYSDENDETDQAKTRNNVDNRASISPQRMKEETSSSSHRVEEEGSTKSSDSEDDDDDEDFVISLTKKKGSHCPLCNNRRFRNAHSLARHMRMHTKEKPFSCPTCAVTFSQSYHMVRHLRNQHGAGQHVCTTCGISLENVRELKNHKRMHMSQFLSCPNSDAESGKRDKVDIKTEDKDSDEAKSQDGASRIDDSISKTKAKGHFCPICVNRCFRGANKLARHMRTHTKEKPFTCPVCALTFSQSYHMTRHLRNQHGLGQYICPKCGKNLSSWLELKAHKRTHAIEGLTCLACDKQFKDKATLVSHLKLHKKVQQSSPRSLICGDCGKVFGRMYHLKRHIMTHRKAMNGERYKCPDCQKNFAFPEDLNKHLEIHVKENNGTDVSVIIGEFYCWKQ
uniref:C2H2-type domain-containing protein n=1 Tax=Anabas testudineus TaxID=64144 RepID=A0A3Q1HVJ7_ANATE